jgi:hypothetical protein
MKNSLSHLLTILNQQPLDFATLDCNQLFDAANYHRVIGIIYRELAACVSVPEQLLFNLKQQNRNIHYQALSQMQALLNIHALFLREGISTICFKGLLLSQRLYGDIGVRQSKDIDLLISEEQLPVAHQLLMQEGYEPFECYENLQPRYLQHILYSYKDLSYVHRETQINVELHWRLNTPYTMSASFSDIWQCRQNLSFMGQEFNLLSPHDEWLYLCFHGAFHGWKRLQWLCDIKKYGSTMTFEPGLLVEKIKQYRIEKHYDAAAVMTDRYFPSSISNFPLSRHKRLSYLYKKMVDIQMNSYQDVPSFYVRVLFFLNENWMCCGLKGKCYLVLNRIRIRVLEYWVTKNLNRRWFSLRYIYYGISLLWRVPQAFINFLKAESSS